MTATNPPIGTVKLDAVGGWILERPEDKFHGVVIHRGFGDPLISSSEVRVVEGDGGEISK